MVGGISYKPTEALSETRFDRNKISITVPLEQSSSRRIFAALGGVIPGTVRHVQIEKNGMLEFGAYDSFHPECIFFGST